MKVLRLRSNQLFISDVSNFLWYKGISTGDRFAISWKIGKRRKIRKYRVVTCLVSAPEWNERDNDEVVLTCGKELIMLDGFINLEYTFNPKKTA